MCMTQSLDKNVFLYLAIHLIILAIETIVISEVVIVAFWHLFPLVLFSGIVKLLSSYKISKQGLKKK